MVEFWLVLGLVGPIVAALLYTYQKKMTTDGYTSLEIAINMHIFASLFGILFIIVFPFKPDLQLLLLIIGTGLVNSVSYILLSYSYKKDALSVVAPLRGITPICVAVIEPLVFTDIVYERKLIGASLLVAVGLYIVLYEDSPLTPLRKITEKGPIMGLLSGVVISFAVLIDRFALSTYGIHPITYSVYLAISTAVFSLGFAVLFERRNPVGLITVDKNTVTIGLIRSVTLIFGLGLLSLISGTRMNILWQLNIIIAVVIGGKIIKEEDTLRRVLGSFLVFGSALIVILW